jgi:hypothetical protein
VYGDQANWSLAETQFPNRALGVPLYASHKGINGWFNPGAFLKAGDGTWGNVRRTSLYGPGINVFNMSAAKSFRLPWEGVGIEFRADAQNVFNHKIRHSGRTQPWQRRRSGPTLHECERHQFVTTGGRLTQLMLRVSF